MKTNLPYKTFNLFFSYNADIPFVDKLYKWVISVGRYIVIGVEMVVLAAFIGRFFLDQSVNDLSDKISTNNTLLISNKNKEDKYNKIQNKIDASTNIEKKYTRELLNQIQKIYTLVPPISKISDPLLAILTISYEGPKTSEIFGSEGITIKGTGKNSDVKKFEENIKSTLLKTNLTDPTPLVDIIELNLSTGASGITEFNIKVIKKV